MLISRRSFFGLLAAPAVIRVADLMPIRHIVEPATPKGRIVFIGNEPIWTAPSNGLFRLPFVPPKFEVIRLWVDEEAMETLLTA